MTTCKAAWALREGGADALGRIQIETKGEVETANVGQALGVRLVAGDFINLRGDLGAGKTVFVRGVAQGLGCDPDDVQSPTFTIVRVYQGDVSLFHLDLYRLQDPDRELEEIGYEEYFLPEGGVAVVEWGDRAPSLLPDERFDVTIERPQDREDDRDRLISIAGHGIERDRFARIEEALFGLAPSSAPKQVNDR